MIQVEYSNRTKMNYEIAPFKIIVSSVLNPQNFSDYEIEKRLRVALKIIFIRKFEKILPLIWGLKLFKTIGREGIEQSWKIQNLQLKSQRRRQRLGPTCKRRERKRLDVKIKNCDQSGLINHEKHAVKSDRKQLESLARGHRSFIKPRGIFSVLALWCVPWGNSSILQTFFINHSRQFSFFFSLQLLTVLEVEKRAAKISAFFQKIFRRFCCTVLGAEFVGKRFLIFILP